MHGLAPRHRVKKPCRNHLHKKSCCLRRMDMPRSVKSTPGLTLLRAGTTRLPNRPSTAPKQSLNNSASKSSGTCILSRESINPEGTAFLRGCLHGKAQESHSGAMSGDMLQEFERFL